MNPIAGIAPGAGGGYPADMFGFYNICKPPGPTSHDIVARMRKRLPRKTRVGHAGTLDPFAQGVLLLAVGSATRLIQYVHAREKSYRTTLRLHAASSTDDATGRIEPVTPPGPIDREQIDRALETFRGTIQQVPPAHSAAKVAGKRAYSLAREGKHVQLAPRRVEIHRLTLQDFDGERIELEVTCSTGTYIRSLARDLGKQLGSRAYCEKLTRTRIGPFPLETARDVEDIDLQADRIDPLVALESMPRAQVRASDALALAQGKRIEMPDNVSAEEEDVALVYRDRLLALARPCPRERCLKPCKVFAAPGEIDH